MRTEHKLAIVIPAYKQKFLEQTLDRIALQTDPRFSLYIGDDSSPYPLEKICAKYAKRMDLHYIRYTENLGSVDLVSQWERCIDSCKEPYIWLFSDDDLMPLDAVERLLNTIENTDASFLRFPLNVIDEKGEILFSNPSFGSDRTDAVTLLSDKLSGKISSAACEYIFRRDLYTECGKFVHFPLAWCSDDATWFKFSLKEGVYNIQGSPVSWRMASGYNISASDNKNSEKIQATTLFLQWLHPYWKSGLFVKKDFRLVLKNYLHAILKISLKRRFSKKELFILCMAVSQYSKRLSCSLYLKYFLGL